MSIVASLIVKDLRIREMGPLQKVSLSTYSVQKFKYGRFLLDTYLLLIRKIYLPSDFLWSRKCVKNEQPKCMVRTFACAVPKTITKKVRRTKGQLVCKCCSATNNFCAPAWYILFLALVGHDLSWHIFWLHHINIFLYLIN